MKPSKIIQGVKVLFPELRPGRDFMPSAKPGTVFVFWRPVFPPPTQQQLEAIVGLHPTLEERVAALEARPGNSGNGMQ